MVGASDRPLKGLALQIGDFVWAREKVADLVTLVSLSPTAISNGDRPERIDAQRGSLVSAAAGQAPVIYTT